MKNKQAKQMIESVTKPPKEKDGYWYAIGNIFPWTDDFMCPYPVGFTRKQERILRKLKRRFGVDFFNLIMSEVKDAEGGYEFEVVRRFNGDLVSGKLDNLLCCYIDEHESGGYSGDSYSGYGYIKISSKDYLKFSYSI